MTAKTPTNSAGLTDTSFYKGFVTESSKIIVTTLTPYATVASGCG